MTDSRLPSSLRHHHHPIRRRRFLSCLLLLQLVSFLPVNYLVVSMVVDIPVPKGKAYLPFQAESIPLLSQTDRILLADEMGLGKTITVIGAFNAWMKEQKQQQQSKRRKPEKVWPRILIISPKSVIPNWKQELTNWLVTSDDDDDDKSSFSEWTVGIATAKEGFPDVQTNVLLINYDIVERKREELDEWGPFDFLVCDEAHYLKTCDSKRTMAILGHVDDNNDDDASTPKRKKKHKHDPIQTERLWLLTGSPILNNPVELYPLLKSIDHDMKVFPELKSFDDFGEKYSYRKDTLWGHRYTGGKNLAQLRKRLHQKRGGKDGVPIMIRHTKDEVLKDLPPKRHQLLPLLDDGATARQEMELVEASLRELATEEEMPVQPKTPPKRSTLNKMKVVELKQLLRANNLKLVGKKEELIERLYATRHHTNTTDNNLGSATMVVNEPTTVVQHTTRIMEDEELYSTAASALRSQIDYGKGKEALYDVLFHLNLKKGETPTGIESQAALNMLTKARHETAKAKVMHGIELIENAIQSHKVVVFAHHRDIQSQLREAFGKRAVGITGGDTLEARTEAIQAFQNDPSVSVFVGSLKAAGTGITLNAANHVVFMELDWSPMIMQQAEDRCHRVGQQSSVLIQYLYFPDTIDEYLAEMLISKHNTIAAAIDEATGSSSWVFDFGKFKGTTVGDVAGTKPNYLRWIVENQIYHRRPELTIALKDLGLLSSDDLMFEGSERNEKPIPGTRMEDVTSDNGGHPENWIFKGGTHQGKSVREVAVNDDAYLKWLANGSLYLDEPGVVLALDALGYIRLGTNNPDDRRSQRSIETVTTTEHTTHIAPDAAPKKRLYSNWKFNFGKYTGETVASVFQSNPGYLNWLVETGVYQNKPELTHALEELGSIAPSRDVVVATSASIPDDATMPSKLEKENEVRLTVSAKPKPIAEDSLPNFIVEESKELLPDVIKEEAEEPLPDLIDEEEYVSEDEQELESVSPATRKSRGGDNKAFSTPGSYKMKFGKYEGSKLEDIPSEYLNWLRSSAVGKRDPTMVMCVNKYLSQRKRNTNSKSVDGEGKGTAVEGFYFYDNGYM